MHKRAAGRLRAATWLTVCALAVLFPAPGDAASCTGCPDPSFGPAVRSFGTLQSVSGYAVADFDGDGNLDLVVGGGTIFYGDGRGNFPSSSLASGFYGAFLAAGDMNEDGIPDIVDATYSGFEVHLGDGAGQFVVSDAGPTSRAYSLVADFDGDAHLDVVTAEAFFPGLGDGRLGAPIPLPGGPYDWIFAVADYDGDGIADFAASSGTTVTLMLGRPSGGFVAGGSYTASAAAIRIGAPGHFVTAAWDLAILESHDFNPPSYIRILVGDGAGGLTAGASLPASGPFNEIAAADFDGDGHGDILATDGTFYRGLGAGAFAPPVQIGFIGFGAAIGDFDRDGLPDTVGAFGIYPTSLAILRGHGGTGFDAPVVQPFSSYAWGAALGDVTGDGVADLVATSSEVGSNEFDLFPGDGSGGFGAPIPHPLPNGAGGIAIADFAENGAPDVAVGSGAQVAMFLGDGAGGFLPPTYFDTNAGPSVLAAGLLNADAHQDLVVMGSGIDVYFGNGAGGFSAPSHVSDYYAGSTVRVADVNGDGKNDIVAYGSGLEIYLGHGDGTFDAPIERSGSGDSVAFADFDGDGHTDIAVGASLGPDVAIFFGDGTTFGDAVPVTMGGNGYLAVQAGDLDGDGKPDLLAVDRLMDRLTVRMGDGAGGFGPLFEWRSGDYPVRLLAGDLNADSRPDFVAVGRGVMSFVDTNCKPRRLGVSTDVTTCAPPGQPLTQQPAIGVYDDGGNVVACDTGLVTAAIVPGTGTAGATLGGATSKNAAAGVATFTDLSIDLAGSGYRIEFSHPSVQRTRTRAFRVGDAPPPPSASNSGPFCQGQDVSLYATAVPGAVYRWTGPNGFSATVQSPVVHGATLAAAGDYAVVALVDGCESAAAITTVAALPPAPGPAIHGAPDVCYGSRLLLHADDGALRHQWYRNGAPIDGATSPVYTVAQADYSHAGDYAVTATDATGCTTAPSTPVPVAVVFCYAEAQAIAIDPGGNGVLDPGETAVVDPTWKNRDVQPLVLSGTAPAFSGAGGATYTVVDAAAGYGAIDPDSSADCLSATGDCYSVSVTGPRPATHWDAFLDEVPGADPAHTWMLHVGGSFPDVPASHPFYAAIETVLHNRVTAGCAGGNYCPSSGVTRAQMAVFLLKGRYGPEFVPPACHGRFDDVPCPSPFADWIEELAELGITAGCGGNDYCPSAVVTRAQMAVFLLRAQYTGPPPCTGVFADVPCPGGFGVDYVEELYHEGVTGGCGSAPLLYCPDAASTRGQMAVFLTRAFSLVLYAP